MATAKSTGCRVISAAGGAKEGTVLTTSTSAAPTAPGRTQGGATAAAGVTPRARGQTEGSVATANAVLWMDGTSFRQGTLPNLNWDRKGASLIFLF